MIFLEPTLNTSKKRWFNAFMTGTVIRQSKSMDWFLYDNGPRHERVKLELLSSETVPSYFEFLRNEGTVSLRFL